MVVDFQGKKKKKKERTLKFNMGTSEISPCWSRKYLFWKTLQIFDKPFCEISTPIAFLQPFGGVVPHPAARWVFGRKTLRFSHQRNNGTAEHVWKLGCRENVLNDMRLMLSVGFLWWSLTRVVLSRRWVELTRTRATTATTTTTTTTTSRRPTKLFPVQPGCFLTATWGCSVFLFEYLLLGWPTNGSWFWKLKMNRVFRNTFFSNHLKQI